LPPVNSLVQREILLGQVININMTDECNLNRNRGDGCGGSLDTAS